jgi:hypothetical protein
MNRRAFLKSLFAVGAVVATPKIFDMAPSWAKSNSLWVPSAGDGWNDDNTFKIDPDEAEAYEVCYGRGTTYKLDNASQLFKARYGEYAMNIYKENVIFPLSLSLKT